MSVFKTVPRIHHVKLRVRDLERSVAFYRDLLGFEDGCEVSNPLIRECVAVDPLTGAQFAIVLCQWAQQDVAPHTLDHICFEVPAYEDVVSFYRRARAAKVDATQPRLYEGNWQTFIFDPDGHKIEVMTLDPGPALGCTRECPRVIGQVPVA